ncbi:MAG: bifunctional 4-hydroxy-2-oxoglutarate aldolase/2-dehydro-3-deoxy-phosphogluconate aldolase [Promethearchaeota archaeon]
MDVFNKIKELKLIPVAVIDNVNNAIPLGKALVDAGLPIIEITFRTDNAVDSIKRLTKELPDMLIGAGTVLKIDQVKNAVKAGTQFIVTPGFNPKVVDYCIEGKIPIIPGVNTPTMVEWALDRGLNILKFFPADLSGGPKMLKSLLGPYPDVGFVPTGGINIDSLKNYLELPNVIACGGSWIVNKDLISNGKFNEIKSLTKEALKLIKSN